MKKILNLLIMIFFLFFLFSCEETSGETYLTLPNLDGKSRSEISEILERNNIKYSFKFSSDIVNSQLDYDTFVSYNGTLKAGDKINNNYLVYVYTTVLPLRQKTTEKVKMDFTYEGKNFVEDGVGVVTLERSIDGDTAYFYDNKGNYLKVRFLGIDTPESTKEHEAWGKSASNYTAKRLNNAKEIVLESEGARTDTYGRYLAFVWVDGVLLNLELIDQAYSNSKLSDSKYEEYFSLASNIASKTGRRFFGEIDPDYDYERKTFK